MQTTVSSTSNRIQFSMKEFLLSKIQRTKYEVIKKRYYLLNIKSRFEEEKITEEHGNRIQMKIAITGNYRALTA